MFVGTKVFGYIEKVCSYMLVIGVIFIGRDLGFMIVCEVYVFSFIFINL